MLYEIAPELKWQLRDRDPAAFGQPASSHRVSHGAILRAQARVAYFADEPRLRRMRGAAKIDYLKPVVLIAVVVVPWAAILWLGLFLVRTL
ncbi:MAG TPA: hypothetical protein VGF92_18805 [Stellaceae bacterium]